MKTVLELFEAAFECDLTNLDLYNQVEIFTSGFKTEKLRIMLSELESFISDKREQLESEFTSAQLDAEIDLWKIKGKELPYKEFPDLKFVKGEKPVQVGIIKYLDLEKLLFPLDLFCCYQLRNLIVTKINEQTKPVGSLQRQLTVVQVALIYAYNGEVITRENCKEIAAKYGYYSKTSGEGLYQDYIKYTSAANRKGVKDTNSKKQLTNRIDLLKSVKMLVKDTSRPRLLDEVKSLETLLNNIIP